MRAHVLLNLLSKLGKRYKMRGLPSILSLFRNEFIRFRNAGARKLYILLSYDKYFEISFLALKRYSFVIVCAALIWTP